MCRQLKYLQHKKRNETDILLEIISNLFKCLTISLVPLKSLLNQKHQLNLFQLTFSVNSLCWQIGKTYSPLRNSRCIIFYLRGQMYTSESTFIRNIGPFFVIILLCLDTTSKKKAKINVLSVFLTAQTFDNVVAKFETTENKEFKCVC